jgi:hypothetical protein
MASKGTFEIVILREKEYWKLYKPSFNKPRYGKAFTKKMHRAEFDKLDRGLHRALGARWEEDCCGEKDFAIMDECEAFGGWHHCGGIYSARICRPEYVEVLLGVLARLAHSALWTYHTVCEVWEDDSPLPAFGEFFIRNGKLYAPKDENDYAKVFGRRK